MAFINKKEEVIKLRLTQHGKHLLSRGKLVPECYAFFDDDIIYDVRYGGGEEHQNSAEDRIKTEPRRDAQHLTTGAETRYNLETEKIKQENTLLDFGFDAALGDSEFDNLVYPFKEQQQEKTLGYPLTKMSLGKQDLPRFNLSVFESEIDNHASIRYENADTAKISIPQLDFTPEHLLVRDTTNMSFADVSEIEDLIDMETFMVNPLDEKIEFADGSFLEHRPEDVIIHLEELNTPYLSKNFELEVFEVVEVNGKEKLVRIDNWQDLFSLSIDDDVIEVPKKNSQRNNFF
tara:strand:+ start:1459 stop:2328 length:870 start_codon:yes stop_codon:yes gene_type:complete